jgi:hypothetical protein
MLYTLRVATHCPTCLAGDGWPPTGHVHYIWSSARNFSPTDDLPDPGNHPKEAVAQFSIQSKDLPVIVTKTGQEKHARFGPLIITILRSGFILCQNFYVNFKD